MPRGPTAEKDITVTDDDGTEHRIYEGTTVPPNLVEAYREATSGDKSPFADKAAEKRAAELREADYVIEGTGPGGKITKADVDRAHFEEDRFA